MAIYEKNGVFNYLDASGNQNILYPVTKSDNVDGLDDELALKVNVADVVNNLTSSDTNKPLSAKQGKALQDSKQAKLVSGTNIKTINGVSILGSGDMTTPIPTASASTLGGVKIGSGINVTTDGTISAQSYSLPTASASVKGGIKVGTNLAMNGEVLNNTYSLPTASASQLGGVKVGNNLSIANGILSASDGKYYGIDASNVLLDKTAQGSSSSSVDYSWNATDNCIVVISAVASNGNAFTISIDGVEQMLAMNGYNGTTRKPTWGTNGTLYVLPLVKGTTISITYNSATGSYNITAYGIK